MSQDLFSKCWKSILGYGEVKVECFCRLCHFRDLYVLVRKSWGKVATSLIVQGIQSFLKYLVTLNSKPWGNHTASLVFNRSRDLRSSLFLYFKCNLEERLCQFLLCNTRRHFKWAFSILCQTLWKDCGNSFFAI